MTVDQWNLEQHGASPHLTRGPASSSTMRDRFPPLYDLQKKAHATKTKPSVVPAAAAAAIGVRRRKRRRLGSATGNGWASGMTGSKKDGGTERKVCASQVALGRRRRNSLDRVRFHRALSKDRRTQGFIMLQVLTCRQAGRVERARIASGRVIRRRGACTPHVSEQLAALGKHDDRSTDADDVGRVDR